MNDNRRRRHIRNGERAFLPQNRMRQIRWEEAVVRSCYKREGISDPKIEHFNCTCGSIECLGVPIGRTTIRKKRFPKN